MRIEHGVFHGALSVEVCLVQRIVLLARCYIEALACMNDEVVKSAFDQW